MRRDPIGYADGANLYQYLHSSPSAGVDPFGLCRGAACPPGEPPVEERWIDTDGASDAFEAWVEQYIARKSGTNSFNQGLNRQVETNWWGDPSTSNWGSKGEWKDLHYQEPDHWYHQSWCAIPGSAPPPAPAASKWKPHMTAPPPDLNPDPLPNQETLCEIGCLVTWAIDHLKCDGRASARVGRCIIDFGRHGDSRIFDACLRAAFDEHEACVNDADKKFNGCLKGCRGEKTLE